MPNMRNTLTPEEQATVDYTLPYMNKAVKIAEKHKNFGILSEKVRNPAHAERLLNDSIINNYARFMKGRRLINHPNVKAWWQQQIQKDPRYAEMDRSTFMRTDPSGYNYFEAMRKGIVPKPQADHMMSGTQTPEYRWISDDPTLWDKKNNEERYIDVMRDRYAPIGAENDPENKNINWAPNVRKSLKKQLGPKEYERWKKYKMVWLDNEDNVA